MKKKRILLLFALLLIAAIAIVLGRYSYNGVIGKAVLKDGPLLIKSGTNYEQLVAQLLEEGFITDETGFRFTSNMLLYGEKITAGKVELEEGWSNLKLVKKLRSGSVATVKVAFHNVRTFADLARRAAHNIEADSGSIYQLLTNNDFWIQRGIKSPEIYCHFIPNTYDFYWNTSANDFVERMISEAQRFWNDERKAKAQALGLSTCEVSCLASIVQEEQSRKLDEQRVIAGLYLNRLRIGQMLQADPTLKFVAGDFSLKQLFNGHKAIDSPYNTYMYAGLPPGPIVFPEPQAIDAVLNADKHDYFYMCAKEDFSGYHNFAKTFEQHDKNVSKWRSAVAKRNRASH